MNRGNLIEILEKKIVVLVEPWEQVYKNII